MALEACAPIVFYSMPNALERTPTTRRQSNGNRPADRAVGPGNAERSKRGRSGSYFGSRPGSFASAASWIASCLASAWA